MTCLNCFGGNVSRNFDAWLLRSSFSILHPFNPCCSLISAQIPFCLGFYSFLSPVKIFTSFHTPVVGIRNQNCNTPVVFINSYSVGNRFFQNLAEMIFHFSSGFNKHNTPPFVHINQYSRFVRFSQLQNCQISGCAMHRRVLLYCLATVSSSHNPGQQIKHRRRINTREKGWRQWEWRGLYPRRSTAGGPPLGPRQRASCRARPPPADRRRPQPGQ